MLRQTKFTKNIYTLKKNIHIWYLNHNLTRDIILKLFFGAIIFFFFFFRKELIQTEDKAIVRWHKKWSFLDKEKEEDVNHI